MRAAVLRAPYTICIEEVPDASIQQADDALVRVLYASICGTDIPPYRGTDTHLYRPGSRMGHEFLGIVEEVGRAVRTLKKGDLVLSPFFFADGQCEYCSCGLQTSCARGGMWGGVHDGGQGEAVRVPFADATLVPLPRSVRGDEQTLTSLLPLTDVMATGYHAARSANVRRGCTVTIIGDGAVGLCSVLAARRLGAERILMLGHRAQRLALAQRFGATETITTRDDEAINSVLEMTKGGVDAVLECVGTHEVMHIAINITRPGGAIGSVGGPAVIDGPDALQRFLKNVAIRGGLAPVRSYIPELLPDILDGRLDPGPVLDMTVDLVDIPSGYAAMEKRAAIKVLIKNT